MGEGKGVAVASTQTLPASVVDDIATTNDNEKKDNNTWDFSADNFLRSLR